MTDTAIDPLAGLPAELPHDVAREHVASLVVGNGVTLEAANAALTSRGAAPLAANSRDVAEAQRTALLNDSAFLERYQQGDPEAVARLFKADLAVQSSSGKITDRPAAPTDYNLNIPAAAAQQMTDQAALTYGEELSKLAASLNMPAAIAQTMTDSHFAAVAREASMSADDRTAYGDKQTSDLHSVLGADAEATLKQASDTLSKASGRKLDLVAICRSNGAEVALMLYNQAEVLKTRQ